jgi:hypothetical protein
MTTKSTKTACSVVSAANAAKTSTITIRARTAAKRRTDMAFQIPTPAALPWPALASARRFEERPMESITSETVAAFRAAAAEVRAVLGAEQLLNASLMRVGPPYTLERWNPHALGTAAEWEPVSLPPARGADPASPPPEPPVLIVEGTVAARDQLAAALRRRGIRSRSTRRQTTTSAPASTVAISLPPSSNRTTLK